MKANANPSLCCFLGINTPQEIRLESIHCRKYTLCCFEHLLIHFAPSFFGLQQGQCLAFRQLQPAEKCFIGKGLLTKLETLTHDACIVFCLHRGIIFPHITERVLRHIRLCELCLYGHQRRGCFRCS